MLKVNIPQNLHDLIAEVPISTEVDEFGHTMLENLFASFAEELITCLHEAERAQEPHIFFNPMRKAGTQYVWEFGVNDLAKPRADRINWHGQNTSQWLYAGCILLQDGRVSRHH
ncbi:MAG: hypothetical protein V1767_01155 [Chloroflexota bacterium]